jgi:hypothetical protein
MKLPAPAVERDLEAMVFPGISFPHQPYFLTNHSTVWPKVYRGRFSFRSLPMLKERVGAEQLADMIARKINVAGVEIAVRKDHAFGWTPTVLSAPAGAIGFQRRAEEIARYLRVQFDLRE